MRGSKSFVREGSNIDTFFVVVYDLTQDPNITISRPASGTPFVPMMAQP